MARALWRIAFWHFSFIGIALGITAHAEAQVPIVYVRCARTTATVEVTGEVVVGGVRRTATRTMRGLDVYDALPDVVNFDSNFTAPCDLMMRDAAGSERVLFDCSSTSSDAASCAAMDPSVSFDGGTVAFTVFRGTLRQLSENVHARVIDPRAENTDMFSTRYPNRVLVSTEAQLQLVDVATGVVTALPHTPGTYDSGPAFLPDGRITFTSSRDGSTATMPFGTNSSRRGTRLYAMDIDGRNVDLVSPHGLAMDEHPFVLRDGRVAFSSWQIFGGITFRYTNGTPGGFGTIGNQFPIFTQHPDGAETFAFFGQHAGDHRPITSIGVDHKAAHFLTQTSDGRVWFADYYRGNNSGLGHLIGVMSEAPGQEGLAPVASSLGDVYAPRDALTLARAWSTSADQASAPMPAPALRHPSYTDPLAYAGKLGHPAALPDNGLMVAWGKGPCSTLASGEIFRTLGLPVPPHTSGSGQGTAMNVLTSLGLDTPGCDVGLYRATAIPSLHPSDLEMIVDSPDWHEIQGRALVPYAAIHGVAHPEIIRRSALRASHPELEVGTPFGLLGAASILDRETHPVGGIHFVGEHQFHLQGTDTINYDDADLCGVRILGVMPNRGRNTHQEISNVAGERVAILGEFPVRNRDASGAERRDANGQIDTSFLVRMPADVPYLMQGIDCDGRTLNTDQSWQSLRPGETKTCGGCHVHSRATVSRFEETFAAMPEYRIPHLGEGTVPLLTGQHEGEVTMREVAGFGLQVDFARDILPIFERRCTSCHGGASPAAELALDRPGIASIREAPTAPSTWWCLVGDRSQQCVSEARRFNTAVGSTMTTFRRPQLTRYVRAFNALGSPLYWKAAGRRTDRNTDATFDASSPRDDQDLDFGPAHTTEITPEELGLLSRWIDIGSPGGPMELRDTQRPTLELAATVREGGVHSLHVGTVDLGSGIDVTSLEVCVLDGAGACADLAGDASPAGIVTIALASALTDAEVEVQARVRDVAGNETVLRRTVGWLLNAPPPPPMRPDAGVSAGDAGRVDAAGLDAAGLDAGPGAPMLSGACGCRATPSPMPRALSLLVIALGLVLAQKRRRA